MSTVSPCSTSSSRPNGALPFPNPSCSSTLSNDLTPSGEGGKRSKIEVDRWEMGITCPCFKSGVLMIYSDIDGARSVSLERSGVRGRGMGV